MPLSFSLSLSLSAFLCFLRLISHRVVGVLFGVGVFRSLPCFRFCPFEPLVCRGHGQACLPLVTSLRRNPFCSNCSSCSSPPPTPYTRRHDDTHPPTGVIRRVGGCSPSKDIQQTRAPTARGHDVRPINISNNHGPPYETSASTSSLRTHARQTYGTSMRTSGPRARCPSQISNRHEHQQPDLAMLSKQLKPSTGVYDHKPCV